MSTTLNDEYIFDIRRAEIFTPKTMRLMVSHNADPLPGSRWVIANSDRCNCWNLPPHQGGKKVAVLLSYQRLLQIFNDQSTKVNTTNLPSFLRVLVKSGQLQLQDVVRAVMQNKVPVGTESEWLEWKMNGDRDTSWELEGIPRLAKILSQMLAYLKPVDTATGDLNEAVRIDFAETIQRHTGLTLNEAMEFGLSGGEVVLRGHVGRGWYKVSMGTSSLAKIYYINLYNDMESEDYDEYEDDDEEDDDSSKMREWWQAFDVSATLTIAELKATIGQTCAAQKDRIECLEPQKVSLIYGGRLLSHCHFIKDNQPQTDDISIDDTLLTEVEEKVRGKDSAHKPRALCYLCGLATVSPSSLKFHITKCLANFLATQSRLPRERQKEAPSPPQLPAPTDYGPLLDAWNREAVIIYFLESSPRCPNCGRTFQHSHTLDKHMQLCCPDRVIVVPVKGLKSDGVVLEPTDHQPQDHSLSQRTFALCYICNRYTGLSSLSWHLRSCAKKFENRQKELPLPLRRSLAEPPATPLPTAFKDVAVYNEEAAQIHKEEVRPSCPACGEALSDVVADVFGFSLMKHMAFCCPDLLHAIEESVLPPVKRTRRGVMGARCLLCNGQFGLAGYGWHLVACYRKYRVRESQLDAYDKRWHFFISFNVKTSLNDQDVQFHFASLLSTENPEASMITTGMHQIDVTAPTTPDKSTVLTEKVVVINRLRSLDMSRAIKKRLLEPLRLALTSGDPIEVVGKPLISRARPPYPPGAPDGFDPDRAWESQWTEDPPLYTQAVDGEKDETVEDATHIIEEPEDGANLDESRRDDPPSYVEATQGWLPRSYGYELDEFNRQVEDTRNAWLPFCPLCNVNVNSRFDVQSFNTDDALRIHMEECCPKILNQENDLIHARLEKKADMNGKPFDESQGIVCYLCSQRTVGLSSYPWHLAACVRVWYVAELCKPKRQRKPVPRLPSHVKLPHFGESDKNIYSAQLVAYNSAALELFNAVGTLQCPKCLKDHSSHGGPIPKLFQTVHPMLEHMDKCCPELIPGEGNADVREAIENIENHVEFMGCVAEHCEQRRRKSMGPAHVGILCHLCNKLCASLAGLEFHRRACMRSWDRFERVEKLPHRRRLFGWTKDDVALQQEGEKYGKNKFYWDVPPVELSPSAPTISHSDALRTPQPRSKPGPVPKPPTTPLPTPPSLLDNNDDDAVEFPSRSEYFKIVAAYNKEAQRIYDDWKPRCPNFTVQVVKLTKAQCELLTSQEDCLTALGLQSLDSSMAVRTINSEAAGFSLLQGLVAVRDTLWSASRRKSDNWVNARLGCEEDASKKISEFASAVASEACLTSPTTDNEANDRMLLFFKRGCNQSYAAVSKLHKHMETCCPEMLDHLKLLNEEIPNPKRNDPIDETKLPGTVCFICSRRVLYLGSLPRHTARCLEMFDAKELNKPKTLRDKPPIPPEHVYGFNQRQLADSKDTRHKTDKSSDSVWLKECACLRVLVARFKAGHRFMSSENEWKYDVSFTFYGALLVTPQSTIDTSIESVQFKTKWIEGNQQTSDDSESSEDDDDDDQAEVLVVTRGSQTVKREGKLELCVGDEVVVVLDGQPEGCDDREVAAMKTLAVRWPHPNALPVRKALRVLQPLSGDDQVSKYTLYVKRRTNSGIDQARLWPSMRSALTEWGVRCSLLNLSKQPRCGRRMALTRTLTSDQLHSINFLLNSSRSPEVEARVVDDEGALLAGDLLVSYAPCGETSRHSLAHGVSPKCLLLALQRCCEASKHKEVTLYLVRLGLRPAFALGLVNTQWCESIEKRPDDMTQKEVSEHLKHLRECGLEEAVDDGDRLARRDRLKILLQGGCGRSFSTQLAVFKHMKTCCLDVIDESLLDEDPLEAASRTLGVQSDAGLQGVDSDMIKYPYGQPGWICYLCGERTLSLTSFKFHLQSCARAWDNYELGKHPSRWRVPPKPPSEVSKIPKAYSKALETYNATARKIFVSIMACCVTCGKTFKSEDALDRHMAACCPEVLASIQPNVERDPIGIDYTLPCHVCGRRLVSADSLKRHLKTCLRAWYRREKDGKTPSDRLDPPPPPKLPIPTNKKDISAYRTEAMAIFEASLPCCHLNTKFPVHIKFLKKHEEALFGDHFGDDNQQKLLYLDKGKSNHLLISKVTKDFTRTTGIRRYDRLLAIVTDDDDWLAAESLQEAHDVFASTTEGYVWFERHCQLTFQDEEKRDKHRASCRTTIGAGLLIPTEVFGDRPTDIPVDNHSGGERSLYEAYGVRDGRNAFVDSIHARVPVLGDTTSVHARGAAQRKQFDRKIAQENAKLARRLASTTTTIAKPSHGEHSRSKFQAVSKHEGDRIARENNRLGQKLRALYGKHVHINKDYGGVVGDAVRVVRYYEGYAHHRSDGVVEEGGPGPLSQVSQWEGRTRIYHNPHSSDPKKPPNRSGAPKTLGVSACSACALKRFHGDCVPLRRCQPVFLPDLSLWLTEKGSFAERLEITLKLLKISTIELDPTKPVFGGNCKKYTDITDIPWYCDDSCAIAGWLTHFKECAHQPKFTGNTGYAAKPEDPWVLKGSVYKGGLVGEARRYLLRARCVVEYPSGQKETIKELDRLVKGRKGEDVAPPEYTKEGLPVYDWLKKGVYCRLRHIKATGDEKLVPVKVFKAVLKPTVKELMEELGRLVIEDQDLLAKVKGMTIEDEELNEGLRCYYCFDELRNDVTYEQHVKVCAMRWRRMQERKPIEDRRPEPKRPLMERPKDIDDVEGVAKWSLAAKEAVGPLDHYNPNGGGALQRYEEAEERAGGMAAFEQLNIALHEMDKTVMSDIKTLDQLQRRIAWEASGGGSSTALTPGTALQDEKYAVVDTQMKERRLSQTHARTLSLAKERDEVRRPRPISDDVMGGKSKGKTRSTKY